ncbi:hypothetical protein COCVIDRAFT_113805, partial [Bipolaris victoriae FI3]
HSHHSTHHLQPYLHPPSHCALPPPYHPLHTLRQHTLSVPRLPLRLPRQCLV